MGLKLVLDIYGCKVSITIKSGHVQAKKESTIEHYCPSLQYDPCTYDMRHFHILAQKKYFKYLKKLKAWRIWTALLFKSVLKS